MTHSRFIQHGCMFNKCRIGKQFRRVRESLLNATGTPMEGRGRPGKIGKGFVSKTEDEQPDKLFLQGGIHNGSEGLYHGVESQ